MHATHVFTLRSHECCADVSGLQKRFVRYGAESAAEVVRTGWSRTSSGLKAPRQHTSATAGLPEAVSVEITRAPAEYAVPVKQDRCAAAIR